MGNVHFPLAKLPVTYYPADHFSSAGKRVVGKNQGRVGPKNAFEEVTEAFFEQMVQERHLMLEAKNKYNAMDVEAIKKMFPGWTTEDILDLKAQFQTFDINRDGLVDFEELCYVLMDHRKDMTMHEAEALFREIDTDGSGAIDFEEFLELIKMVHEGRTVSKSAKETYLGVMGSDQTRNVKRLSIAQQITHGLF